MVPENKIPIAVISDGKPGHENQSLGIAERIPDSSPILLRHSLQEGFTESFLRLRVRMLGVSTRNACSLLRQVFDESDIDRLINHNPKAIISSGTLSSAANLLAGKLTGAKTCVCMKPSMLPLSMYDLAVIPAHDNPPAASNIVKTLAAPNRVSPETLSREADLWWSEFPAGAKVISWVIGGPSASVQFNETHVLGGLLETLVWAGQRGWQVWLSTARRTPVTLEDAIAKIMKGYPALTWALLWHRDRRNPLYGMFERSTLAVVTSDSVSMIAEAASAGKGPVVFQADGSRGEKKHPAKQDRMVENLLEAGYGARVRNVEELTTELSSIIKSRKDFPKLNDTKNAADRLLKLINS